MSEVRRTSSEVPLYLGGELLCNGDLRGRVGGGTALSCCIICSGSMLPICGTPPLGTPPLAVLPLYVLMT